MPLQAYYAQGGYFPDLKWREVQMETKIKA